MAYMTGQVGEGKIRVLAIQVVQATSSIQYLLGFSIQMT